MPFAAAAVVHVLVNLLLMWGVLRVNQGRGQAGAPAAGHGVQPAAAAGLPTWASPRSGWSIAALFAVMFGAVAALLVLVPLFVARWAMGQFAEQQRAYAATMAALCQAVETKDFYTRGHSERVSRGSGMIARQIGMRPDRAEALVFAGMLHDVGKLGVPTKVLQKAGPLTEEEYAAIQLHPMRGLEIVREIGFLNEALAGIMHHHERIDGRGYPMGFAGDEIPEFARIIGVADAFDSITSTRSYRKARTVAQGVEELRKGAGSQFDPAIVAAFIAALGREGWKLGEPADAPPGRPDHGPGPRRPDRAAAGHRDHLTGPAYDDDDASQPVERWSSWQTLDSGRLLLLAVSGMLVLAALATTLTFPPRSLLIAVAFGLFIAFGELLRLALPGGREAAPIAMVGAPGLRPAAGPEEQPGHPDAALAPSRSSRWPPSAWPSGRCRTSRRDGRWA